MASDKKNPKKEKNRIVLLDSHAILHRAYHALPEFVSSKGEPTGALYGLSAMLIKIIADLKPDYIIACFDLPKPTHRHEAYDAYKAGRKKAEDDLIAQIKRSYDIFKAFSIPSYALEGFEADDLLGTLAEKLKKEKENEIIIASGDMDTLQLVEGKKVQVYTLKKGIQDTILYDEKAVEIRFGFLPKLLPDYKGLRGDPSDNIIGISGIGEKTATILIQNFGSVEEMYKKLKKDSEAFKKAGLTDRVIKLLEDGEEEALFSKMLATIRKDAPVDFKLPEKKWKDEAKFETINALFNELDFRTLGARVKESLFKDKSLLETVDGPEKKDAEQPSFNSAANEKISPKELKETSVALWLVNSAMPNPAFDDILRFAKTMEFSKAKQVIFNEIEKRGLRKVWEEIEKPLIPVVEEMNKCGIKVNKEYLAELSKRYHKELEKLQEKIWKMAGGEFNINSPKQLGEVLFDKLKLTAKNMKKTAGGARSTRESELEKLREVHPVAGLILDHRELQKLLSTYIDNIPQLLDKNNRLHSTFIQHGTTTGRMSSQEPNLQNIPIRSELGRNIRNAFVASEGMTLLGFDYSQIELRIAAILSGDTKLIQIFQSGEDVHASVAASVFKVSSDKVTPEMRRKAKIINFGILYGMGVNALRQNLGKGTTREESQQFLNTYFETFEKLAVYMDEVKASAARLGYTTTLFGRRRYFEGISSRIPYVRAEAERMAINAPIQGTQADIVKLAMVRIDELFKRGGLEDSIHMLLQVHDELIFEVKKDMAKKLAPKIKEIMENVLPAKDARGIPIIANAKMGEDWGTMEGF